MGQIRIMRPSKQMVDGFRRAPPTKQPFPNDDTLLAQKLLIESSEAKFIADANITYASSGHDFEPVDSFAKWCRNRVGGNRGIRRR